MSEKEPESKEYIIKEAVRDNIVNWLDDTQLPHKDVKTIISALKDLEEAK